MTIGWPPGARSSVLRVTLVLFATFAVVVFGGAPPDASAAGNSLTAPGALAGSAGRTDLVLDASGYPAVVYFDNNAGDIWLLRCNDPNCAAGGDSITQLDPAGGYQESPSLALDASGNPVVAYHDGSNLRVLHCNDPNCVGGESINVVDSAGDVGDLSSLDLDASGNPVVAYYDATNGNLKVAHCLNPACALGNVVITTPDTAGTVGAYASLVLDAAGFPVVSYGDITNGNLKLLHCNDANCAGGNDSINAPDTAGSVGSYTSLALDLTGNPVVSYFDSTNDRLKVLHCDDANCAGGGDSIATPDNASDGGWFTSLALAPTGFFSVSPVVTYFDTTNGVLKVLRCNDPNCSGGDEAIISPDTAGNTGWYPSLALDGARHPVVSYFNVEGVDSLRILHCSDNACTGNSVETVDGTSILNPNVGEHVSLALDAAGFPVASYYDATNTNLKILHCNDADCAPGGDSITAPDTAGEVGFYTSLVLDVNVFPVVSYTSELDLKIMHCNDPNCAGSNESITSPDTSGDVVGATNSLALDAAGNPVVSYLDVTNATLKVMHCNDPNCAGGGESITSPDPATSVGSYTSLALDALGRPVVSYHDFGNGHLKLLHCNDANCAGGGESITSPDTASNVGAYTSLELDASGFPVVSYFSTFGNDLKVLHCNDPNCVGGDDSISPPDTIGSVGLHTSLALDASGNPAAAYYDASGGNLKVIHCNDANCAGSGDLIAAPDVGGNVGEGTSLAVDVAGNPVVAYYDASGGNLKVLHCTNSRCTGADDMDLDGCLDGQEAGANAAQGGQRNAKNFWDFYDVPTGVGFTRDQSVSALDIFAVIGRFSASGNSALDPLSLPAVAPAYHTAYDRGPSSGPNPWNLTAANGSIAGTDIFAMIGQFNHSCA